ncbi:hypothetical protein [Paraburkholderia xenovorans]|uniref:hypothetical protein n=1 Tax=Paraburkholderia xenovorans TaxID=36873 RepID=UPI0015C56621|nr:hypothetical protein [Paraburkholderia xenovorans]NPT39677.1 hypothetical protein [Paraburkholderia xenovorans]
MAAGLQVWDASGNLILDASYRVMRLISFVNLSGNGASGSVTDSRFAQGGFVSFQPATSNGDGYLDHGVIVPVFTFSGSTLSWSYPAPHSGSFETYASGVLFYGAY